MKKKERKKQYDLFSCGEGGRYDINTLLKWLFFNSVLVSFCFGWRYAAVTALSLIVVSALSETWYNKGRYADVVDEYEQDGYPSSGWDKLLQNWKILAVVLFVIGIVILAVA